jgi:hypothetical protein
MNTRIGEVSVHELIDELVRRIGVAETCRQLELPESTDLHQLATPDHVDDLLWYAREQAIARLSYD